MAIIVVMTFYLSNCLRQETAKGPFSLRFKLPPAHLSTTHGGGFTLTLSMHESQARKLQIPTFVVFGVTRLEIQPWSIVSVRDVLSTRQLIGYYLCRRLPILISKLKLPAIFCGFNMSRTVTRSNMDHRSSRCTETPGHLDLSASLIDPHCRRPD